MNKSLREDSADGVFRFEDSVLSLDESTWVDTLEFERLCSALSKDQSEWIASLEEALALYQGDLLPDDLYAEWTLTLRESLRRQYREASLALAALYRDTRQYDRMFPLLTPLLAHDLADEPVHRELMRAYAFTGRRHQFLTDLAKESPIYLLADDLHAADEASLHLFHFLVHQTRLACSSGTSEHQQTETFQQFLHLVYLMAAPDEGRSLRGEIVWGHW